MRRILRDLEFVVVVLRCVAEHFWKARLVMNRCDSRFLNQFGIFPVAFV